MAVSGRMNIKHGRLVVQPPVVQARSVRGPGPNELEEEARASTSRTRTPRRRPTVGQSFSKKRKALEFDSENEDEGKEVRKSKVYTPHETRIDRYSCVRYFQRIKRDRT